MKIIRIRPIILGLILSYIFGWHPLAAIIFIFGMYWVDSIFDEEENKELK